MEFAASPVGVQTLQLSRAVYMQGELVSVDARIKTVPKGKMNSCCKGAAVHKPQDRSVLVHVIK